MVVIEATDDAHFATLLANPLVIVDFYATWCGPCKLISPWFHKLSDQYEAVFVSVDVDKLTKTAKACNISAMPTFVCFRNGQQVDMMKGADKNALETFVKKNLQASVQPNRQHRVLNEFIDMKQVECLNQDSKNVIQNILRPDNSLLKSDCDEQLLMRIVFKSPVKIQFLRLKSPSDGPKEISLFVNTQMPNFDDVLSLIPTQKLDLDKKDDTVKLNFVKFQNVNSIVLFVNNNQSSSDQTVIEFMEFIGLNLEDTDMSKFSKESE